MEGFSDLSSVRRLGVAFTRWEPGWVLLNLVFKPFGFFTMIMFTSLMTCLVFYRFFRNYVPASYQWLGMFIYMFDPYMLFVPASAMRQNMGILLFLFGIEFLYKKRFFVYFLLACAAWSFHLSGKLLIPMMALSFVNIKINRLVAVLCVGIYVVLFLYGEQVFAIINSVTGAYFEKYTVSYEGAKGAEVSSGLGLVYSTFMFMNILYFAGVEFTRSGGGESEEVLPGQSKLFPDLAARRFLFKLAIVSFMFSPLALQLGMIGRINMYFMPVMIAVYPIVALTMRNALYRMVVFGAVISVTLYGYILFFTAPGFSKKFGTYQTIFSALQWY
jgi:hypothetical protein